MMWDDDAGYDLDDPKHPRHHEIYSGVWDNRDKTATPERPSRSEAVYAIVGGWEVSVSANGVLYVRSPKGTVASVLPRGTHAALDVFGPERKQELVEWWHRVMSWR